MCEQLAKGCYTAFPRVGFERATYLSQVQRCTRCTIVITSLTIFNTVMKFMYQVKLSLLMEN